MPLLSLLLDSSSPFDYDNEFVIAIIITAIIFVRFSTSSIFVDVVCTVALWGKYFNVVLGLLARGILLLFTEKQIVILSLNHAATLTSIIVTFFHQFAVITTACVNIYFQLAIPVASTVSKIQVGIVSIASSFIQI